MSFYGDPPQAETDPLKVLEQYAPVVQALLLPKDPAERRAVLAARIKNLEGMKRRFPIGAVLYDNEIRKLRAKLSATTHQIEQATKGETSVQIYRYVGWAVGAAGALVLLTWAYRNIRPAKR